MRQIFYAAFLALTPLAFAAAASAPSDAALERSFGRTVHPFVETYCVSCHKGDKPKGDFDITAYASVGAVARNHEQWKLVLEKLESGDMPPDDAKKHPTAQQRAEIVTWIQDFRKNDAKKHAGDPGLVLARRLSNSEYDYSIRDITGVDIQPTREFPVDPSNTAGFDNSGESLTMSPALVKKYLAAARDVASHLFLKPQGFAFAPTPMLVETDRDQYCVMQIIDFYHRQNINLSDYFQAAWTYKNRAALGRSAVKLEDIAAERKVSPKYLATVWAALEGSQEEVGPLATLQTLWRGLPAPTLADGEQAVRDACGRMRDYVVKLRAKVEPRFLNIAAGGINSGSQTMMIWKNVQYATHRMTFDPGQLQVEGEPLTPLLDVANELGAAGEFGPGRTRPIKNEVGDPDLVVPAGQRERYEAAFAKFCRVFPDKFYMEERGRNYFDTSKDRGRYLSAGFHSNMGYFRDDQPLAELILDDKQRKELDAMWVNMDFIASTTERMYIQFNPGQQRNRDVAAATKDPKAPKEDAIEPPTIPGTKDITTESAIERQRANFLAQAAGGDERGLKAIDDYFTGINSTLRRTEKDRLAAEPSHLEALQQFAARAYRRPLAKEERDELKAFYLTARKEGLDHEAAMRDGIVSVLMAPDFCYRLDRLESDKGVHALSDFDLASRLSYFLWSSVPDAELLAHAAAGDLHQPKVVAAQAKRMLKDQKVRGLAVEFGGNWLDFRRFEGLATVDRERFASFNDDLRKAMYEEPVRFLQDVFQHNRSVLDFLYANDTFVNPALAKHYGMPVTGKNPADWVRVEDANRYDRGGVLPMAAFLTKNAPGLRTSPVKRGNWVVKNVLGERIPPPPPNVPELARDEAHLDLPLRDMLARHRDNPACASCHDRFDALGLVFEGFGPIGERREKDLAGRPIDASATFPGGATGAGMVGLKKYIQDRRQNDFVDNLCGKLVAFALGRSLIPSDDLLIQDLSAKLIANGYHFESVIEGIVTSPQFLNKRARADLAAQ